MIDVIFNFTGDRHDVNIATAVPTLPQRGDSVHFVDTDREVDLYGEVDYNKFEEVDGDLVITVVII